MNANPTPDADLEAALSEAAQMCDAPSHVIYRAEQIAVLARTAATPPAPWRRVLAQVRADSALTPGLALGLRGEAAGARQMLLTSGDHDIDLRIEPPRNAAEPLWQIWGQVMGPQTDAPGAQMQVFAGEADPDRTPLAHSPLGEFGDFRAAGLPAGRYQIAICLGAQWIALPPLTLGDG